MRALLVAFLALPLASATGTLQEGPVVLHIENSKASDCVDPTGLCLATRSGSAVSDSTFNATQQDTRIGVAVDGQAIDNVTPIDLLPGRDLWLTPHDYVVPNPVFWVLIRDVGAKHAPGPLADESVQFTPDHYGVTYDGPTVTHQDSNITYHEFFFGYSDNAGNDTVDRDTIRAPENTDSTSTDNHAIKDSRGVCVFAVKDPACDRTIDPVGEAYENATPNVVAGIGLVQAGGGTDPDGLSRHAGDAARRASAEGPGGARGSLSTAGQLSREAPLTARPLSTTGGTAAAAPSSQASSPPPARAPAARTIVPSAPPPHSSGRAFAYSACAALAVVLAALYAKIRSREQIMSGTRLKLFEVVKNEGPRTVTQLAQALGLDRSTAEYHARMLAAAHCVTLHRVGRSLLVALPEHRDIAAARRTETADRLLDIIRGEGGSILRQSLHARAADIPHRTRNAALQKLREAGSIEDIVGREGPVVRLAGA